MRNDDRLRPTANPTTRKIAATAFALTMTGGLTAVVAPAVASPNHKPTIDQVKAKVDRLYHKAEIATEHYDNARTKVQSSQKTLSALDADLKRQQKVVDGMRSQVAAMVVQQYQGQSLSNASQVVLAKNPKAFVDNVSAMSSYDSQRGNVMSRYATELQRLQLRKKAVHQEYGGLAATKRQLAADKATIAKNAAAAKRQLNTLTQEQQAQMQSGGSVSGPVSAPTGSGKGAQALRFALAQVGKPYVWGAAGPSSYDCSGLTMAAYASVGISLPHSAAAQAGMGTPVSESQLQPGDLVFYYSPISHVGMYVGHGMIVNAENPSVGVKIAPVNEMPFAGAVRLG